MEEMETEGLTPDEIYRPQDVVWVKVSPMWWVAEVQNQDALDPEVTGGLKKKPLVVVKFLTEDTYEFVRSYDHIYHYNCKRKEEFLKHGFKKYYKLKNEKNVARFPGDIKEAELRTGGDPEIVNDPKYLPQEVQEPSKVEKGERTSLPADFKGRKAIAPRRSAPAPSRDGNATKSSGDRRSNNGRPPIVKQGPSWYPYPKFIEVIFGYTRNPPSDDESVEQTPLERCSECRFETPNSELLMLHHKYKQHQTVLANGKYRWRNPESKAKAGNRVKKSVVRRKKDSASKPAEKRSVKKKYVPPVPVGEFTPPKRPKMSLPGTPSPLEVSQACAKIIEEWTDDEDESKTLDETAAEDLFNCSASTNDNTMETTTEAAELRKDAEKRPAFDTTLQKVEKPSGTPKSSSCFDFDEEEPSEPELQSSGKFGQIRLPRVITPEKSKPPEPLVDGNDIDSLLKEVSVPEIPSLPPSKQDSLFSRGDRTYGSSPFKDTNKPSVTSPVKSDSNNDVNADMGNNKNEEKHFLAEGPLQSKKRRSFGRTEGAEDGSAVNKKLKVGTSPQKPSNEEVVARREMDGESSKIAARILANELAKQSLIDTLTYSPKSDDHVTDESRTAVDLKRDQPTVTLLNDSALDETLNCSIPRPSIPQTVEGTSDMVGYDRKLEYDGGNPRAVPCEIPERTESLFSRQPPPSEQPGQQKMSKVVMGQEAPATSTQPQYNRSEMADVRSPVGKEAYLSKSDLRLESALSDKPKMRRSQHSSQSDPKIQSPGGKEDTIQNASEAQTQSSDYSEIDPGKVLIPEFLEASKLKLCESEKYKIATNIASSQDISQEACMHAPPSRSNRNKSVINQDVPGVLNQLVKQEVLLKEGVDGKSSKEVPDQSESHIFPHRKSQYNVDDVSESPKQPQEGDSESRNADKDIRCLPGSSISVIQHTELSQAEVVKAEDIICSEVQDSKALVAVKEETVVHEPDQRPGTTVASSPNISKEECIQTPPSRVSKRNKSVAQDVPGDFTQLSKQEELEKVVIDKPSQEVPGLSESDPVPSRKSRSEDEKYVPAVGQLPDNESRKAGSDVIKCETLDTSDSTEAQMMEQKSPKASQNSNEPQAVILMKPLPSHEETEKRDEVVDSGTTEVQELLKLPPTSSRKSMRNKMVHSQEIVEPKKISEDTAQTSEVPEATVDAFDSIQSAPKPSRKSMRNKSVTQEPTKSPSLQVDEAPKIEESLKSGKRNKKFKSCKERPELQLGDSTTQALVTQESAGSMKSPSSKHAQQSEDIIQESVVQKPPRESRKANELKSSEGEPKVQPENDKIKVEADMVPPDVSEPSQSLRVNETFRIETTTEDQESPRASRRNKKFKSSKASPELLSLPTESTPKADVSHDIHESTKSHSSKQKLPSSDITQELVVQKHPRASRKTKKLESSEGKPKVQPESDSIKVEADIAPPVSEPSPTLRVTATPKREESLEDQESPRSSRKNKKFKSSKERSELQSKVESTPKADVTQEIDKSTKSRSSQQKLSSSDITQEFVVQKDPRASRKTKKLESPEGMPKLQPENDNIKVEADIVLPDISEPPPTLRVDGTPKREGSPEDQESPRSSRRNKKFRSSKEMPELQSVVVDLKADITQESDESMKPRSSEQAMASSDFTQEPLSQRPSRASRKTKKLECSEGEPKVQPKNDNLKVEAILEKVPPDVSEPSPTLQVVETPKREDSQEEDEPPRSSRRNKKKYAKGSRPEQPSVSVDSTPKANVHEESDTSMKSWSSEQAVPATDKIIQRPMVQKPLRASRETKEPESYEGKSENDNLKVLPGVSERLKSPSRKVTISKGSPKIDEAHISSRRSQRNRSQEVPVSIPLPEDRLPKAVSVDPKSPQENVESLGSPTYEASGTHISSNVSPKVNESPQSSKRRKRINSQEVPVSIPLPDGDLPNEENTLKIPLEITESLKSPTTDEASHVHVVSSPDISKVDESPTFSKKSKKNTATLEVPVSIPLPEKDLVKCGAAISDVGIPEKFPRSSRKTREDRASPKALKLKSLSSDEPAKADSITTVPQEDSAAAKFPSADKTSTPAVIVPGDSKAKEQPQSSKKSKRHKLLEEVPESTRSVVESVALELKPVESSNDGPMALMPEAIVCSGSKSQPSPAEKPQNVEAILPTENLEPSKLPCSDKVSTNLLVMAEDSKTNHPLVPSRKSRRISSQEALTSKPLCEVETSRTETTTSEIPQDKLKPSTLPSLDEAVTSKLSLGGVTVVHEHPESTTTGSKANEMPEAALALEEDKPPSAGVPLGQETSEDLGKQVVDGVTKGDSPNASFKLVFQEPLEPKLLPESVTPKPGGIQKKVPSEVAQSRSESKDAKSKEKDRKAATKSGRQEKSGRESRSASKEGKDISKGEVVSRSESMASKRESTSKEKERDGKDGENCAPRLKLVSQVDMQSKGSLDRSPSFFEQVPSEATEKRDPPELSVHKVARDAPLKRLKDAAPTQKSASKDLFDSSSPRKKKSKWDVETPKVEEAVMDTVETSKHADPGSEAVKNAEENTPSGVKPLEITVFDCSKNEILVDTDLAVSSSKKQMAHSPSKTFRQDEAASLLEELLGSSPKSSPTSSPKKAKAVSPTKVKQDSPGQRSGTGGIKFSLSPSKVLDFGSPAKANDVVENSSGNPPLSAMKSPNSGMTDALATPFRASRWDSPFPMKSSTPPQSLASSPAKAPRSPSRKVKVEIKSGFGRSCFKSSSQENNVALDTPPKLPVHLEADSSNNQSDDEMSALQAEIMSYSAMDKAKSALVPEVKSEVSDLAKELGDTPNSQHAVSSLKKVGDKEELLFSPAKPIDVETHHVNPEAIPLPPEPSLPIRPSGLSEADLLASLDDAISIPLNEPVTTESIRSLAPDSISSTKPSNAPILLTVPSDSMQGSDSVAPQFQIVGTARQTLGNGLAQSFGSGADLLEMDLDINSLPIIMQEESISTYPEAPVAVPALTPSTSVPIVATTPVSSIPLPSEQLPPISALTSTPRISNVATPGPVQTTSSLPVTAPMVHSVPSPPEPSVLTPPVPELEEAQKEEIIETEIVMDHSETDQQDCQTSGQSLEEKFAQALVKQPWLRPDLLELMTKDATEKKVFKAKKVTQLVISLYDEDHPDYAYYMSLPPCQVGTSNFTPSWAAVRPSKTTAVTPPSLASSTNPSKTILSTSAKSIRQISSTTNHASASRPALSVDKSKSIVTVARPEKVGEEEISADSSTKPISIVGTQSVPVNAVRQSGASPAKPAGSQVKQQLLQLLSKAQSGELDPETTRRLNAIAMNPGLMAKIQKQQKTTVSSRPSAEVKVQPRNTGLAAKAPILRASPTAKIMTSVPGSPTVASQAKPVVVPNMSTSDGTVNQPKPNILSTSTRVTEPLKFTMESKFRNIQISNNSPKFVVACDPVTGVPAVKSQIVVGRSPNTTQPVNTLSAGPSRSTNMNTTQTGSMMSSGSGRSTVPSTLQTMTLLPCRSTIPSTTQTIAVVSPGPGRNTIPTKAQPLNTVIPGSSSVKVATALPQQPRPRMVQRMKTVAQPILSNVAPTARLPTHQTARVRKQTLPQGQPPQLVQRSATSKPETFTYVTITNKMVIPTTSEQVYVVNQKKPTAVAPGSDILAKALADTDILPSDSEPFAPEDASPDLFSPASVVITGSLGADQLSTISCDPAESDNVNR